MKKISRIILLFIVLASVMIPVGCTITPEKSANGLVFRRNGISNTCSVVGYKGTDVDVVIPSSYKGWAVTAVAKGAFSEPLDTARMDRYDYKEYYDVSLGLKNKEDANYDEYYYTRVKTVVIPSTVTSIGDYAFQNCSELVSVTMTNNVSSIGRAAFTGCKQLSDILLSDAPSEGNKLPSSIKNISDGTFFSCAALESVTVPASVKKIGKYAFSQCGNLKEIYLGDETTSAANDRLASQTAIADTADVALKEIDNYAFKEASSLKYIKLPSSVTTMGLSTFESATSLVSATLSDHINSLGKATFKNCVSLDETLLDLANVKELGVSIFEGCTTLQNLDSVLNDEISVIPEKAFYGCTGLEEVNLSLFSSITRIDSSAFRNCSAIKTFVFNDNTDYIGAYALRGCTLLRSVLIPENTRVVGDAAFAECDSLVLYKALDENNKQVEWVGWKNGLEDDQIIDGVTKANLIGDSAAEYVVTGSDAKLTRFLDDTLASYTIPATVEGNGKSYNVNEINGYAFKNCNGLTDIKVPASVSKIGGSAFAYATSLTTIDVPSFITSFEPSTFANCESLTTINFVGGENAVTKLGDYVFDGCAQLDNVEFKKATSIGTAAFRNCENLSTIRLGQTKTIPAYAFENCAKLTDLITLDASETEVDSIESIGAYAFSGCTTLADTAIPESVKTIGESAFRNCENFVTVHITASVTSIGNQAFKGCKKIEAFVVDGDSTNYMAVNGSLYELKKASYNYAIVTPDGKILAQNKSSKALELVDPKNGAYTSTTASGVTILFNGAVNYRNVLRFVPVANTTYTDIVETATDAEIKIADIFETARAQALALGYTGDVNALGVAQRKVNSGKTVVYPGDTANMNTVVVSYTDCISAIGSFAFEDTAVKTVTLPASVSINEGAFNGCTQLERITITAPAADASAADLRNSKFGDIDGALYEGKWEKNENNEIKFTPTKLYQYPSNNGALIETLTLPETVTDLKKGALMDCNIGTLVLDRALANIANDAFKNAKIGEFVLDSAALFNGNIDPETNAIIGTLEAVDPDTVAEKGFTKVDRANEKFAIDEYGILYAISPDKQNFSADKVGSGVKRTTVLYVPETVSVPGNVLHLDNYTAITLNAYSFSANTDIETIVINKNTITLIGSAFEGHASPLNVIYVGSEDDYIFESAKFNTTGNEAFIASKEEGDGLVGKVYALSQSIPADTTGRVGFWYYVSGLTATGGTRYYGEYGDIAKDFRDVPIIYREEELDGAKFAFEVKLDTKLDDDNVERYYKDEETREPAIFHDNNGNEVYVIAFWHHCDNCGEYSQTDNDGKCPTCDTEYSEAFPVM